jgi:hypothetical protein
MDGFMKYLQIVNGVGVRSASLNDGGTEATLEAIVPTIQKANGGLADFESGRNAACGWFGDPM